MLEKKEKEHDEKAADWLRKAELAVDRGHDDLARAALERQKGSERTAESFRQQVEGPSDEWLRRRFGHGSLRLWGAERLAGQPVLRKIEGGLISRSRCAHTVLIHQPTAAIASLEE
jgi:hypothetical protein